MQKLTITVDQDVYDGLYRKVGRGRISRFINDLARARVTDDLEADYLAARQDSVREAEADEWVEGLAGDLDL
jgi:predicted CopG family antitoxin